jgi:hypothetical protein
MLVSVDTGHFAEAIRSMERIFLLRIDKPEWKSRILDEPILQVIMNCITQGAPDESMQNCKTHIPKFESLLKVISEKYSSSNFYSICAAFYKSQNRYREYLEYFEKSYRYILHDPLINESLQVFQKLVTITMEFTCALFECKDIKEAPRMGNEQELICPNWAYQAKMALKAVIGRTKSTFGGSPEHDKLQQQLLFISKESKKQ